QPRLQHEFGAGLADPALGIAVPVIRHHENGKFGKIAVNQLEKLKPAKYPRAVHPGHYQIEEHERPAPFPEQGVNRYQRILASGKGENRVAGAGQKVRQKIANSLVVLDNDDLVFTRRNGFRRLLRFDLRRFRLLFISRFGMRQVLVIKGVPPVPLFIYDPGAFHGQELRIEPLFEHELKRVYLRVIDRFNVVLEFELEIPLIPREERVDHPFDLLAYDRLDLLRRDTELLYQDRPEPFPVGPGLLRLKRLVEALLIHDLAFEKFLAEVILDGAGGRTDNLTEAKNDNTLPSPALESQNP